MENALKIHMIGAAAVVVSGVKAEDWKLVEKYAPDTLTVTDENGEPVFRAACGEGTGSMTRYGIEWGSYLTEEGYPTVTMLFDTDVKDRKAALTELIGTGLTRLKEIEQAMPGLVEKVREEKQQIESHLEMV